MTSEIRSARSKSSSLGIVRKYASNATWRLYLKNGSLFFVSHREGDERDLVFVWQGVGDVGIEQP